MCVKYPGCTLAGAFATNDIKKYYSFLTAKIFRLYDEAVGCSHFNFVFPIESKLIVYSVTVTNCCMCGLKNIYICFLFSPHDYPNLVFPGLILHVVIAVDGPDP